MSISSTASSALHPPRAPWPVRGFAIDVYSTTPDRCRAAGPRHAELVIDVREDHGVDAGEHAIASVICLGTQALRPPSHNINVPATPTTRYSCTASAATTFRPAGVVSFAMSRRAFDHRLMPGMPVCDAFGMQSMSSRAR
jgi:hypothetical protein